MTVSVDICFDVIVCLLMYDADHYQHTYGH